MTDQPDGARVCRACCKEAIEASKPTPEKEPAP